jgi:hypothetical protein
VHAAFAQCQASPHPSLPTHDSPLAQSSLLVQDFVPASGHANSQRGPVRPTSVPSGQRFTSIVQTTPSAGALRGELAVDSGALVADGGALVPQARVASTKVTMAVRSISRCHSAVGADASSLSLTAQ